MSKWLALGTALLIAILAVLWLQIREPAAAPVVAAKQAAPAAPALTPEQQRVEELKRITADATSAAQKPGKLDPRSDAFFYKFDEAIPPALTKEAAKCYTGGLHRVHRNAKVKLGYKITIK